MPSILHIVGTRPQYIKLYPLFTAITKTTNWDQIVYDTGQHFDFDMSGKLISEFDLTDSIQFGDIKGMPPINQMAKMIVDISEVLDKNTPDYIYLYGDTNTTMAAAIVAAKKGYKFGHIEAGVRTDPKVGIQEGKNRLVADALALDCFCVVQKDHDNLLLEGKSPAHTHLVGDLMYDAFQLIRDSQNIDYASEPKKVLVTIHRAENVDDDRKIRNIISALIELGADYDLLFPMHPRLANKLSQTDIAALAANNVEVVKPLSFKEMVKTLHSVQAVITDSGGLPKDAACAGVGTLVLRNDPIWHDLHSAGYIKILENDGEISSGFLKSFVDSQKQTILKPLKQTLASDKIISLTMCALEK